MTPDPHTPHHHPPCWPPRTSAPTPRTVSPLTGPTPPSTASPGPARLPFTVSVTAAAPSQHHAGNSHSSHNPEPHAQPLNRCPGCYGRRHDTDGQTDKVARVLTPWLPRVHRPGRPLPRPPARCGATTRHRTAPRLRQAGRDALPAGRPPPRPALCVHRRGPRPRITMRPAIRTRRPLAARQAAARGPGQGSRRSGQRPRPVHVMPQPTHGQRAARMVERVSRHEVEIVSDGPLRHRVLIDDTDIAKGLAGLRHRRHLPRSSRGQDLLS